MAQRQSSTCKPPEQTPALFLDRDGVINRRVLDGYVTTWQSFQFLSGSLEALRELTTFGLPVFVITNQSCVNRGILPRNDLDEIHARMTAAIARHGGLVTQVYICPHRPDEECDCRKPKPGLLLRAACEYGLDLRSSWFVGDTATDVLAGQRAGCRTCLVRGELSGDVPGDLREQHASELDVLRADDVAPTMIVSSLSEAARRLRAAVAE